jgi:type VI protein secretion system component VasK
MLALMKNRAFLVALGLLLLALLIWFVGPYFAFADYKPLESVVARLVAIIVLAVGYAIYVQLRALRSARAGDQLAKEVSRQEDAAVAGDAPTGDSAQLRKRFDEAVEALKKSKRGANLYELPWYIIIGPPGAGKTTVLVNSGLNFPLAQNSVRKPCGEWAAHATATGGSPMRRSCWTPRADIRPRTPTRGRMPQAGAPSWSCCASSAAVSRSTG